MDILTVNGVLGGENIDSSSPMHPPGLAEAHGELGEPVADAIKEEEAEQANATNLQETQEWLQWQEWQQYKEETEQDGLSWDQQGLHMANDQVWSGVGSASADHVPKRDLTRFGHLPPPRGGWMCKVIPLIVSIKMMAHQRTWSIAQRLGDHVAIREHVIDHHLQMLHRGFDRRYYTR